MVAMPSAPTGASATSDMQAPASSQKTTPWGADPSSAVTLAVNVTGWPVRATAGGVGESCTVVVATGPAAEAGAARSGIARVISRIGRNNFDRDMLAPLRSGLCREPDRR